MPYCPNCKFEYVEGIEQCPDCEVPLVDELPVEPIAEDMAPVYYARDDEEAFVVKTVLEDADIPVWEEVDVVNELNPLISGLEPIAVPISRVDDARKAIEKALEDGRILPTTDAELTEEEEIAETTEESP